MLQKEFDGSHVTSDLRPVVTSKECITEYLIDLWFVDGQKAAGRDGSRLVDTGRPACGVGCRLMDGRNARVRVRCSRLMEGRRISMPPATDE